jgi:hypothetical protein
VVKISASKIKRTKVGELANMATLMSAALFGNLLVFFGLMPFTAAQVLALINDYIAKKAAYEVGGLLQKPAYTAAKKAIINCILAFGIYVDSIALGNLVILGLSTLPTDEDTIDIAALIAAGAKAENVSVKQGITGQIVSTCKSFGKGVNYLVVISEGAPLDPRVTVSSTGLLKIPSGLLNTVYVDTSRGRNKRLNGLTQGALYYISYVLIYDDTVGVFGDEKIASCGN